MASVHVKHIVLLMSLQDVEWTLIIMGAAAVCGGHHGERTHSQWMRGCRLSDCRGMHVRMKGRYTYCLGVGGETRRTLASLVAHEEGIPHAGMRREVPYTRSEAEQPGSSRQAVLMPRSTSGSSSIQRGPWRRALRDPFNCL